MNILVPLADPLNNLRRHLYAFGTDIEAFFHNVLVDERDKDAFRFFFFKDGKMDKLDPNRFMAHVFGAASSSMVTAFVLKYHANVIKEKFGEKVYEILRHYFYVDDGIGGDDEKERYRQLKRDLQEAMAEGGFTLSKWKFSHPELIGHEGHVQEEEEKILGIRWNTKEDTLSVVIESEKFEVDVETLRQLVKLQATM